MTEPDVVLLDLHMPGGMGLDALPAIRAVAPHARVLVLSGFRADEMEAIALERGADGFVQKGDIAALRAALAYEPEGPNPNLA
ncbi:MAG: hypothetical protein QOI47_1480 [Actinomycetota bacterium]|nr:hypothetical protein [Actinomycetota bacterium]